MYERLSFFFLFFLTGRQLLYNIVLVSDIEHHESVTAMCVYVYTHISPLPQRGFLILACLHRLQ